MKTKPVKRNSGNTNGERVQAIYPLGLLFQLLIFETASNSHNIKLRDASLFYEKMNISPDFLNDKIKTQDEYDKLLIDAEIQ